jgi:GntR family transcriptional repressor for pyruvate dehydrogenase complex
MAMSVQFKPITRPSSLSQVIVENVEKMIMERKLVPGQKLPTEQDLCEMFSVSRTAVREALRMLSAKGLITVRKRSGIFVNDLSTTDVTSSLHMYLNLKFEKEYIIHVFNLRQVLEPEMARWAALARTEDDLHVLQENLWSMERTDPQDRVTESRLDQEFHMAIATASHNPVVHLAMQPVYSLMPRIREVVYTHTPNCESSALMYHRRIANAIRAQDTFRAFTEMQMHISLARKQAEEVVTLLNTMKGHAEQAKAKKKGGEP